MVLMLRSTGAALCAEPGRGAALLPAIASPPTWRPSVTRMLLPSTLVVYGSNASTLTTRRERPLASAASTVSTPPERTSMRRDASASVVFGRSKAMRAGLSMVKGSGSGAGPLKCSLSCTTCPDVCTSMLSSLSGSAPCARTPAVNADRATSARPPIVAVRILNLIMRSSPCGLNWPMPTRPVARYIRRDHPV